MKKKPTSISDKIKEQMAKPIEKAKNIAEKIGNQVLNKVGPLLNEFINTLSYFFSILHPPTKTMKSQVMNQMTKNLILS